MLNWCVNTYDDMHRAYHLTLLTQFPNLQTSQRLVKDTLLDGGQLTTRDWTIDDDSLLALMIL